MKKKSEISKRQSKFLYRFLGTKSLEDLLPIYTSAISNNNGIFKTLPEDLTNPIVETLREIQAAVGYPEKSQETDFDLNTILRNLRDLNGIELLSNYIISLTKNAVAYSEISEEIRTSAEYWLDELRACVTGKNGLFSNEFDPETYVDGFIEAAGGERVSKILGSAIQTENADYFFRQENVILELKILKSDFLGSNIHKLNAIRDEFLKTIKITPGMILGTDSTIPKEMFDAQFDVIRDALQKVTKKANRQIKNTKELLNTPDASGIVLFLIDGFYSVNPFYTIELLHEPLSRQFSAVNAFIFVNFRRKARLNLGDGLLDYFIFEPRYKENFPISLPDFINRFGAFWFEYLQHLAGKRMSKHILSYDSRNLINARWK